MTAATSKHASPLVVRLLQRIVPRYRLPVFDALGDVPDLSLEVWANFGAEVDSIDSVTGPEHFRAVQIETRRCGPFYWESGAMAAATTGPCDVLIASWNPRNPTLPRMFANARRAGRATLLWGHGFGKAIPVVSDWLRDHLISCADGVIFYGPTVRDRYVQRGYPPEKLFVAPNAIDQRAVRSARRYWLDDPRRLAEFRERHGIDDSPLLVYLSRLEPDKRPDLLIRAMPEILRHVPTARIVFIGKGSERERLEGITRELRVDRSVLFTGAIFEEHELAPWCLSARALVHPGGIGLTLFHAFGFGLPVVTTDRGRRHGPEVEVLRPGENGLLFRDGDVTSLAKIATSLLTDAPLRDRLARGALLTVDGPGGRDVPQMVAGFVEAIRTVAARRGKAH